MLRLNNNKVKHVVSGVEHYLHLSRKLNHVDRLLKAQLTRQTVKIINFQYNRPNTDDD